MAMTASELGRFWRRSSPSSGSSAMSTSGPSPVPTSRRYRASAPVALALADDDRAEIGSRLSSERSHPRQPGRLPRRRARAAAPRRRLPARDAHQFEGEDAVETGEAPAMDEFSLISEEPRRRRPFVKQSARRQVGGGGYPPPPEINRLKPAGACRSRLCACFAGHCQRAKPEAHPLMSKATTPRSSAETPQPTHGCGPPKNTSCMTRPAGR